MNSSIRENSNPKIPPKEPKDGSFNSIDSEAFKFQGQQNYLVSPQLKAQTEDRDLIFTPTEAKNNQKIYRHKKSDDSMGNVLHHKNGESKEKTILESEWNEPLDDLDRMKIFKFYFVKNNFTNVLKKMKKRRSGSPSRMKKEGSMSPSKMFSGFHIKKSENSGQKAH